MKNMKALLESDHFCFYDILAWCCEENQERIRNHFYSPGLDQS